MKTVNGLRAALYARVSTSQQEEEATIESQIAAVETYAKAEGYELQVAHYYLDQAVSGAKMDRPGLNHLRDAAAGGEFDVVLEGKTKHKSLKTVARIRQDGETAGMSVKLAGGVP